MRRALGLSGCTAVCGAFAAALVANAPRAETVSPHSGMQLDALVLRAPHTPRVHFPQSRFVMGSSPNEAEWLINACLGEIHARSCLRMDISNEGPRRKVQQSEFWLDRFEVTVQQYDRCVAAGRCNPVPYYSGAQRFRQPDYPVSLVTWFDARDYCNFAGGQLPTEAQWERAARGIKGRRYPWGNLYNSHLSNHGRLAWSDTDRDDGFVELAPVGSFPDGATTEQVFDLAGNVEEWTFDRYAERYDAKDVIDPTGPPAGSGLTYRSVRGGSYISPRVRLRGASRTTAAPDARDASRGFRCARVRPVPTAPHAPESQ